MNKSKSTCEAYDWGNSCKGWHLVKNEKFSVIQELMPAHTEENFHKHEHAQQLFFILKGTASFIVGNENYTILQNESIHIESGKLHKISK